MTRIQQLEKALQTMIAVFNSRGIDPLAAMVAIEQAKGVLENKGGVK
jgi:hypothetical protein